MSLSTGDQLGPYEILALIGKGGMGEVYKARDTRLGREVAIKVSAEQFTERFEREARAIAALNHPNICQLYDVGPNYLVMELVEGVEPKGPLPVDTALNYARQMVDALEAAHANDIVHRDLKPGNIKIKSDGTVKVLDFGLAKIGGTPAAKAEDSPTLSMAATQAGMILGTAAYMSPEQARGKQVDKRADIWAFGVVLYEMLTGKQLFHGDDITDTLAAVLRHQPDWEQVPPKVRRLLERCLEKDPQKRLRDIGDAWQLLEEAPQVSAPVKSKLPWGVAAALVIALAAVVIHDRRSPPESDVVKFFISAPDKMLLDTSGVTGIPVYSAGRISPNGRKLAFAARDESGKTMLWVRSLDALAAQPLIGTEDAALPFWSPDSRSIAFFAQGKMKRMDLEGGPPLTICDAPSGRGGSWNRAGVIVFAPETTGPLKRVSPAGGDTVAVTALKAGQSGHKYPSFLLDDRHFLYTDTANEVFTGSLDSVDAQQRFLLAADSPPVYTPPGYLLFVRQGALLAQPFDAKKLRLSGDPIPIAEQLGLVQLGQAFSVSENGILTYRTGVGLANLQLTWVDATGKLVQSIATPGGYYLGPDLSPDGKRIAIHRHESAGGDVWIVEVSTGKTSRFTFDASQENASPIWSPDGNHIAFGSRRNGKWGIYRKLSNGTGTEELLFESEVLKMPMSWSADDKWILYMTIDAKTGQDIWALPLSGDRKAFPILQTPFNEGHPQFSPDGKWFAYESNETGRSEIYIQSFPPGTGKWQISSNGGWFARWSRDGRKLFYMDALNSGKIVSVGISAAGSTLESSVPMPLFDSAYINTPAGHSGNWNSFAVSSDSQRFLIPRPEANANSALTSTPITVVLNWTEALRKK
jgi:serine/threonine protein kinase